MFLHSRSTHQETNAKARERQWEDQANGGRSPRITHAATKRANPAAKRVHAAQSVPTPQHHAMQFQPPARHLASPKGRGYLMYGGLDKVWGLNKDEGII